MSLQNAKKDPGRLRSRLILVFAAASAMIIGGGIAYHRHYQAALLSDAGKLLTSIARFKVDQLNLWRNERLEDTLSLLDSPMFSSYVSRLAENPDDTELRNLLKAWFTAYLKHNRYKTALLAGPDGKVVVAVGTDLTVLLPGAKNLILKAASSARPEMGDFHFAPGETRAHIDLAALTTRTKAGKRLFLVLQIDPEDYLYPLIQSWPTNSRTGETLLVRKEGEDVLFLNKLRHRPDAPMKLRLPLSDALLPAARALKGETGVFKGIDYRGKEVLAAAYMIPGTPWAFVAKMDLDELMADSNTVSFLLLTLTVLMLVMAGGGTSILIRLQTAEYSLAIDRVEAEKEHYRINFETLADRANDMMLLADPRERRLLSVNRKACESYGYTAEELLELKPENLIPPENLPAFYDRLKELTAGKGEVYEVVHIKKDGTRFPVEVSACGVELGGKKLVYFICRDITERKRAEKEHLSHLRFLENMDRVNRAMQPASDLEKMMRDVLTEVLEIFACDRAWLFYPCDPAAPAFQVPMEITRPEYPGAGKLNTDIPMPPDLARDLKEVLGSAAPVVYTEGTEKPVNRISAGQFGVKSQMAAALYPKPGKPWVFGIHQCSYPRIWTPEESRLMQEIGRRLGDSLSNLLSHRALEESERELKEAQRIALMGNWTLTPATGELSWSNEIFRIFGLDPAAGEPAWDAHRKAVHPDDWPKLDAAVKNAVSRNAPYSLEFRVLRPDGSVRWVLSTGKPETDPAGKVFKLFGTTQDITGRKLLELEKETLNAALAEKNREMENFLYITTHDLRTPLVNIQGFSQNLERYMTELREALAPVPLPAEARRELDGLAGDRIPKALGFVLESSRKMDALISALLKVSRLGRVEMKPEFVDAGALLKKIIDSMRYQLETAGGEIKCGKLPPCKADPGGANQLFTNLLDNAIKYRREDRALRVNVTGEIKGKMVIYKVADNGSGIPETELHRIWNVFYRNKRAPERQGEGIGLPMVRRLAEKNGGGIRAESRLGEGSVFYVELPAAWEGGKDDDRRD